LRPNSIWHRARQVAPKEYTHAARQRQGGGWTSKLGKLQDIEHDTLDSLSGSDYGTIVQIMRKDPNYPAVG
jgi:hypothetical protein